MPEKIHESDVEVPPRQCSKLVHREGNFLSRLVRVQSKQQSPVQKTTPSIQSIWFDTLKGTGMGLGTACVVMPFICAKNRAFVRLQQCKDQVQRLEDRHLRSRIPFLRFREHMSGLPLLMLSVAPQMAGTLTVHKIARYMMGKQDKEKLSVLESVVTASCSGAVTAVAINPLEVILQNVHGLKLSIRKATKTIIQQKGYASLTNGVVATVMREAIMPLGYLARIDLLEKVVSEKFVSNKMAVKGIVGCCTGTLLATATIIPDACRANRQFIERGWCYRKTFQQMLHNRAMIKSMLVAWLFRSGAISAGSSFNRFLMEWDDSNIRYNCTEYLRKLFSDPKDTTITCHVHGGMI